MGQVVRRAPSQLVLPETIDDRPIVTRHASGGLFVESNVTLGVEPKVYLAWSVTPYFWGHGYRLLIFRSTNGFAPEQYPHDLNRHGQLIVEARQDDRYEERPPEGTYFYTCVLHKSAFFGLIEHQTIVRFSETIPSGKVALGRVRDQVEFADTIRHEEVGRINHEGNLSEAEIRRIRLQRTLEEVRSPKPPEPRPRPKSPIETVLSQAEEAVDAIAQAHLARQKKLDRLKADPDFQSLSSKEQKRILKAIDDFFDPAEISARVDATRR